MGWWDCLELGLIVSGGGGCDVVVWVVGGLVGGCGGMLCGWGGVDWVVMVVGLCVRWGGLGVGGGWWGCLEYEVVVGGW